MDNKSVSRRRLLQLSAVASVPALSGCASIVDQSNSQSTDSSNTPAQNQTATENTSENDTGTSEEVAGGDRPETISEPELDIRAKPLLEDSESQRYPTLGTADETVTVYGNWKCPYTQQFVRQQFGDLVEEFVAPGDVSIEFRTVSYANGDPYLGEDAPRAAEAGLAVWDIDPAGFWDYFAYVFANQPQERFEWATTDNMVRFAEEAGVDGVDQIRQAIRSRTYNHGVEQSAERADEIGISTVPRVVYGDSVTAPTVDPESTREQFEQAANEGSLFGDDSDSDDDSSADDDDDSEGSDDDDDQSLAGRYE